MADPTTVFEGFSVTHAAILDGSTTAEDALPSAFVDVYGVRSGSVTAQVRTYEHQGDDGRSWIWSFVDSADVSIVSGYISFATLTVMTSQAISSSNSGVNLKYWMDLWSTATFNRVVKPMLLRILSKDNIGNTRRLDLVLYKVMFQPFSFGDLSYKAGLDVTYSGRAVQSAVDERGVAFGDGYERIGRIISAAAL